MKIRRPLSIAATALAILAVAGAAPAPRAEKIGPCTDATVSEAMRAELASEGWKVTGDSGVLCEVWLRKVLPQRSSGGDVSTLAPGTFAGVIRYASKGGDYRGQAIRAGTYALRYQTIPQDGNHLGVSPTSDFFLLSPVADDKDPKAVIAYAELVKLSKAAAGTNHPNPLNLATPTGTAGTFHMTDEGHGVLEVKARAAPAGGAEVDLPLAIVLIGKAEG